jgi:hypothetical protein
MKFINFNLNSKYAVILLVLCFGLASAKINHLEFLENSNYATNAIEIKASIKFDAEKIQFSVIEGVYDETSPAFAIYKPSMEMTGWDSLALSSYQGEDNKYSDEVKSYAMGYLEGYLTSKRIWNHYQNCNAFFNYPEGKMPLNTKEFLTENRSWVYQIPKEKGTSDPYWHHAYLIYRQFEGMIDAYNASADLDKKISVEEAMIMNSHDITELAYYKKKEVRPKFNLMSANEIFEYVDSHTHCSALIKVAADFSDVWFGHNTWTSFASMTRIFKEYRFKSNDKSEKARTIAMSSYPGAVNSIDDFYVTSQDLFVTETTNSVFNTELYDLLSPKTLLVWQRVMVANRLSTNGREWTQTFALNNSGTYNNQFQVLDLKLIDVDNNKIENNALWIVEQIPGYTESADVTHILKYGYWPGYNSAYFPSIRKQAGYDSTLEQHPELRDSLDYQTCARANIFRRDQAKVTDFESYKHLMRYNKYQSDPLSKNNPALSIAARKDLDTIKPDCRGATDAKVASIRDIKGKSKKTITVISGPTTESQTPFDTVNSQCISANKGKFVFNGLPEKFNFGWVQFETTLFGN